MKRRTRMRSWATGALIASAVIAGCSPSGSSSSSSSPEYQSSSTVNCRDRLASVVERDRAGDTSTQMVAEMDSLSRNCKTEYTIATDYFSAVISSVQLGQDSCAHWRSYSIREEAIALLREDGLCTESDEIAVEKAGWPDGGLGWNTARAYAGTNQRVCGPLASVRGTQNGVFVNIGQDYPSTDRFTFVIWGDWWLDPIADNATICGSGNIYIYEGVTQIELGTPGEIEIWQ